MSLLQLDGQQARASRLTAVAARQPRVEFVPAMKGWGKNFGSFARSAARNAKQVGREVAEGLAEEGLQGSAKKTGRSALDLMHSPVRYETPEHETPWEQRSNKPVRTEEDRRASEEKEETRQIRQEFGIKWNDEAGLQKQLDDIAKGNKSSRVKQRVKRPPLPRA